MPGILALLQAIVPLIPSLIETGKATVDLYDKVSQVISENRAPNSEEWDALERQVAEGQAVVRDTSRDVPTG